MADVVDRIISELIVQGIDKYEAAYQAATKGVDDHIASLRRLAAASKLADDMMANRGARGVPGSAEAKEANAAVAAVKGAAKEKADAEKAAAREAADAVKAAEREKTDAVKATAREQAAAAKDATRAAEQRAAAEKKASDAVIAAAEREAAAKARLAEVAAARIAQSDANAARRVIVDTSSVPKATNSTLGRTVPREPTGQSSIPSAVLIGSGASEVEVEREINHLLADDLSLRARQTAAAGEEAAVLRDQRTELALIAGYKRAGLSDDEAALRIEADLAAIEKSRAVAAAEQRAANEAQLRAQAGQTASHISLIAPTIVGGITAHEISGLNDEYIKLSNSLKIAGVGAASFDQVQGHLLATANRTGTDLGALADLYRSAALASHDLGASQTDLLKVSDAVANALRIQGRSSEEARGAILQLGHAFESGRVTAREFNSLALNLYPILQAVAKGSDQYGGSVAKLRQALLDGDITSKVFFQDLLKGSADLESRAAKASLTTAQGFNALRNSLVVYFGEADKSQGVSRALGAALSTLAGNLDTLIPAIVAIGTALASGYIVRMGAAALATKNLGGVVSAAFGGPTGLAITAVALAVGTFATEANTAAANAAAAHDRLADLQAQLGLTAINAHAAAGGVKGVGTDALGAIPHVDAFAGANGRLAQQLYNVARAARSARVETLQQQLAEGQKQEAQLGAQTGPGRRAAGVDAARGLTQGDVLGYIGNFFSRVRDANTNLLTGGKRDREAQQAYEDQVRGNQLIERQIREAKAAPITESDIPGGAPTSTLSAKAQKKVDDLKKDVAGLEQLAGGATGARLDRIKKKIDVNNRKIADIEAGVSTGAANAAEGGGAGRRGPSAETLARRAEATRARGVRDERQFDRELRQAQSADASEQADLTNDASARAEIERKRIREAAKLVAKEIASRGPKSTGGTGEYSAPEVKQLVDINDHTAQLRVDAVDLAERRRTADDLRSLDRADIENQRQALQAKQALATTTAQRRDLAKQLLDLEYKQKEYDLNAVLDPDSKASAAEKKIARDRLALLPGQKDADQKSIDRQNEGKGASYLRSLSPDRGEFIEGEEVKALQDFNQGLDDSVAKALHLHGIFGDIVKDLIDMAIKQAIIKPIASALFGGGSGGGSGGGGGIGGLLSGLFSAIGGAIGGGGGFSGGSAISGPDSLVGYQSASDALSGLSLPGFASGGSATIGGRSGVDQNVLSINGQPALRVGKGEQLTVSPQNQVISPNNSAIAPSGSGGAITVHVEANDYFDARVAHVSGPIAQQTSVRVVKAAAPTIIGQAVNAAPGRVSQVQTLGS